MREVGVTGIHIAERDTQRAVSPKPIDVFWNTWSVDGFISEGLQPAELGWGTHERWMPANARIPDDPAAPGIFLEQPGAETRVRTWCPSHGEQYGFLVTHNEALSIPDFFTVRSEAGEVEYRPTCHYAYHPCNDAVLSFHELFGAAGRWPSGQHVLDEDEIVDGRDELGVLLYGHARNAYWYGSQLTIEEARELAPYQNATGLQVTSAVLAGIVWALENPTAGIVETDDMDHAALPRGAASLSRQRRGRLHRLDPARRPPGAVRRRHRHRRSLAVPQRPRPLSRPYHCRAGFASAGIVGGRSPVNADATHST